MAFRIPQAFRQICGRWHGGERSAMYQTASHGVIQSPMRTQELRNEVDDALRHCWRRPDQYIDEVCNLEKFREYLSHLFLPTGTHLEFDYVDSKGEHSRRSVRLDKPLSDEIVVGWDYDRGAFRSFRLERMTEILIGEPTEV